MKIKLLCLSSLFILVFFQTSIVYAGAPDTDFDEKNQRLNRSIEIVNDAIDSRHLQSLPGCPNVMYIDFDGQTITYGEWTSYSGFNPLYCQPAGITSNDEITVWKVITEDYRPFNVNITTDSTIFVNAQPGKRQRLVVTTTRSWQSVSTTGISINGSFTYISDAAAFVFPQGVSNMEKLGEVGSHELGHTLNLSHDGVSSPTYLNYFTGYNYWAPLMGNGFSKLVTQWSKGEYSFATNTEDDIQIISSTIGFRTDDHANNAASATSLNILPDLTIVPDSGIIEKETDVDYFKFQCGNGAVSFTFNPTDIKPNLDIKVTLYNQSLSPIYTADDSGVLATSINTSLTSGTYYLGIEGAAYGSPLAGGYSKYGSLGLYTISGSVSELYTGTESIDNIKPSFYFNQDTETLHICNVEKKSTINIYNMNGNLIYQQIYENDAINISGITPGIYIVMLSNAVIGKFVK